MPSEYQISPGECLDALNGGLNRRWESRSKGGGLDWFLYRKKVLHNRVHQLQWETGQQHWLCEDNTGNRTKAARLDTEEVHRQGIDRCDWPSNSLDLNMSEQAWRYLKDMMAKRGFQHCSNSRETVKAVKVALMEEWERLPQELIDRVRSLPLVYSTLQSFYSPPVGSKDPFYLAIRLF
ncbi:hypothetical protein FN846DRAFT_1009266 [Sphaerosporella brunnea]|uniref:Tc1-like transposase DDE domain-containing protein n=1 Tax=Sphaerosporella brunnea TaxID=1250544 RepID=A0A5J5F1J2_9PEZI|nr:hypothetical protein FN846DRAFT_1009266 [Sphaerosporella brunnea]